MKSNFITHLNVQTNSNLSFSLIEISELVSWANEKNLEYLAIADYYPYEILQFHNLCWEKKIKPIWGIKLFVQHKEKNYPVTIYPRNNLGYKNIIRKIFGPTENKERIFASDYIFSLINDCLIVFEAKNLEEIKFLARELIPNQSVENNISNFYIGFNFFLASPQKHLSKKIISLLLPFFSIKVLEKKERNSLSLLRENSSLKSFFPLENKEDIFSSYSNIEDFFSYCTDNSTFYQVILVQIQSFIKKIDLKISLSKRTNSSIQKENKDSFLSLQTKCWQQLLVLKKDEENKYQEVLKKELSIIEKLGYAKYFLVFSDTVNYLREQKIEVGPGRGSAVSSLTAYLLEITSIDPLQHGLIFERFLNEKRTSFPDIDLDVREQKIVFEYLRNEYGEKNVARIATRQKIGWKNAFKESSQLIKKFSTKFFIDDLELKEISDYFDKKGETYVNLSKELKVQRWKVKFPLLFDLAEKTQKLFFNSGIHPSGIIISEKILSSLIPLKIEKEFAVSFYSEEEFSLLGLKKYDFLSLTESLNLINEAREIFPNSLPSYQEIDLQDKKTWQLLTNSLLTGIFQLDTPSSRLLWNNFQPQNFSDLILFLALNRPGAKSYARKICQRRWTKEKEESYFSFQKINDILRETYGFIVFEEQLSQIWAFCADFSFTEAEIKRRKLGKLVSKDQQQKFKEEFTKEIEKKISSQEIELLWKQIIESKEYTFNKAHAVAYSYLCYYIAYLKANYFSQLIIYLLEKSPEKTLPFLNEAFFYGFQIEKPDINYSQISWTIRGKSKKILFMGFSKVKNFYPKFFQGIIDEREKGGIYKDWEDFLNRTIDQWKEVDLTSMNDWIKIGLFRSLRLKEDYLLKNISVFFRYCQLRQKLSFTGGNLPFPNIKNEKIEEKVFLINQREREILGYYLSYFKRWKKHFEIDKTIQSLTDFTNKLVQFKNKTISLNIYAVISKVEKKERNIYLTLQDITSSIKTVISWEFYQNNKEILLVDEELIFTFSIKVAEHEIIYSQIKKISLPKAI